MCSDNVLPYMIALACSQCCRQAVTVTHTQEQEAQLSHVRCLLVLDAAVNKTTVMSHKHNGNHTMSTELHNYIRHS